MNIYKLISSRDILELEREVNKYLGEYEILGSPFVFYENFRADKNIARFAQALIRKDYAITRIINN